MQIEQCIDQQKKFYEAIMKYLSNNEAEIESKLSEDIFQQQDITQGKEGFRTALIIISKITENYHRSQNFIAKVSNILLHYSSQIKQTFTNSEIFEIFKKNKRILLLLFEQKIIIPDESISQLILEKSDTDDKRFNYDTYLYPEIKEYVGEYEKFNEYSKIDQEIFNEKRRIGQNDSHLCELIRQDSIENFVIYVNKMNINQSSKIKPSIFETNLYLIENDPSIIEYAAFYGSIQIFQYLANNNYELTPSLWHYSIHSNNSEMIQYLELNNVSSPNENFESCLKESIKCHLNDIADYIITNLMDEEKKQDNIENDLENNLCSYCFEYFNFHFVTNDLYDDNDFFLYYLCRFDHYQLVDLYYKYYDFSMRAPILNKFYS